MSLQNTARQHAFYYYAATLGAWAPLVAIILQFLISRASPPPETVRTFVMLIPSMVMLVGFLTALIGLFGILVHKTKGILFRTIIGICIPLALLTLAIPTILRAKERSRQQQAQPGDVLNDRGSR